MKQAIFILCTILLFNPVIAAQTKVTIDLQKQSKLTIHAATNLLKFTLEQEGQEILNKPMAIIATEENNKLYVNQNKLILKVKNFESNNPIAQSEFYKMMQTEKHPHLRIQLNHFDKVSQEDGKSTGNASVSITITGVTKQYNVPVSAKISGNLLTLEGRKKMTIRDFGIEPPVAMLGIVRVSEWIEIDFNLVCKIKNT
jgi:hypothetical protein